MSAFEKASVSAWTADYRSTSIHPLDGLNRLIKRRAADGRDAVRIVPEGDRTRQLASKAARRSVSIRPNQRLSGSLNSKDSGNPKRRGRYADDFLLRGALTGQRVTASLSSGSFDTYLQVIDGVTGRVIAQNDDVGGLSISSRVSFTIQPGITYRLRVTSYESGETGNYTLVTRTPAGVLPGAYNDEFGYGLVDAAAAVARAVGEQPFADVPDLGGYNWGADLIKAPEVWARGFTGKGITVAVLDVGVDYNHVDLRDNIWRNPGEIAGNSVDDDNNGFIDDVNGWNFVDGSTNNPIDLDSHGTHVSGTIAAVNNGFGVTGMAYDAKIMPVKVIGGLEDFYRRQVDSNVAAGIRYATQMGAQVISMSLGTNPGDPPMTETEYALRVARQAGVVVVMASGNEKRPVDGGATQPIYPALYAGSNLGLAVGAVNGRRQLASFSNPAGERPLDLVVAPGVNVRSTIPGDQFANQGWDGTSMATPHVSAVVALMLSANPNLTPDQVEEIIVSTANPRGITIL